jgi:hypothetical protein
MKTIKNSYLKITLLLGAIFITTISCEREVSDDIVFATFPKNAEVFVDGFSGGLQYWPFGGSKLDAFSVDTQTKYYGSASMRFDVPNYGDPEGAYAGAVFPDATGRDLTDYDALTFWAKASEAATINEIGFGADFEENKYLVTKQNLRISTNWQKYTIPIPDAYKLTLEKGMFWYAEGPDQNGNGYTFWIDELKFEKLGTVAQPQPAILDGEDVVLKSFTGAIVEITGTQTFNLASGINETVSAAPSYFTFNSTDVDVARVSELGIVSIVGPGSAKITAILGGVKAKGSLNVEVSGAFETAPVPTRNPSNVISIFSDTYTNVPVDFFNGYWEPYQTTQSTNFEVDGNNMISYTEFNFVGNQFANPTVNATEKSNLHLNMYIPDEVPANMDFLITIVDFGADGAEGGDDDTREQIFFDKAIWTANTWITLEFPITLANKSNMGLIIYENINFSSLENFYLDNIYFYKQ